MPPPSIHIVGAGMAGLAAAAALAAAGLGPQVTIHEASNHAGGRCRSFHDAALGCVIDNGNHLILGANPAVFAYLDRLGRRDALASPPGTRFPFVDLASGERWVLRPNAGRLPWWFAVPSRRVPGSRTLDYLRALRLLSAGPADTVADRLDPGSVLYRRLWEPLTVAVLNADPAEGSARLMGRVVREVFGGGGAASRPYIAAAGLSAALVDPALAWLAGKGVGIRFGARVRALQQGPGGVRGLELAGDSVPVGPQDRVVLAVPPAVAGRLLPGLPVPEGSRAIVNLHYRLPGPLRTDPAAAAEIIGLVGSAAHWLFLRESLASVTISAADRLLDEPDELLGRRVWSEVAAALGRLGVAGVPAAQPPFRLVKEKRATFLQSPANEALRPATGRAGGNLLLAGDWTATGLPATIEGAIRSGNAAAAAIAAVASGRMAGS
ncbi:MAG: hydroxysqualene dehydroxylase HpnE [Dongiaceae bacterium]